MTAAEILSGLQAARVAVRVDGDNLLCRPRGAVPAALLDEVTRHKPEIIALIRAAPPTTCPHCHQENYMPLGGNWRRCWVCGRRWGPVGSLDPGDPTDPKEMARLLRLTARPGTVQIREPALRDAGDAHTAGAGDAQIQPPTGRFEYGGDDGDARDGEIPSCSKSGPQPYPAGILCRRGGCRGLGWTWDADQGVWRCRACGGPLAETREPRA